VEQYGVLQFYGNNRVSETVAANGMPYIAKKFGREIWTPV